MGRLFTVLGAILLLLIAAAHIYRIYSGMDLTVNGQVVPMTVSYVGAAVFGIIGLLQLITMRR